jgi:thiamine-phosphate pyrophosphorylase
MRIAARTTGSGGQRTLRYRKMRGLYPIVDVDTLQQRGLEPLAFAHQVLSVRPPLLQLRAKRASARDTLALLRALLPLCRNQGTLLFANDRPDLALLAGVDGVHVGQDDLTPSGVRELAPGLRIGLSTHSLEQLEAAFLERPDYVAFGPVFATHSKQNPEPTVGLEALAAAAARAQGQGIPLVAIGGIELHRAREVARLGALGAVIGALVSERLAEVSERARQLHAALGGEVALRA